MTQGDSDAPHAENNKFQCVFQRFLKTSFRGLTVSMKIIIRTNSGLAVVAGRGVLFVYSDSAPSCCSR